VRIRALVICFEFEFQTAKDNRGTIIASEAKQSRLFAWCGLLSRFAPRNDVNPKHGFAISPPIYASFALNFPPSENRGRRECRAPDAPAAARVV
jgi:hypothetical protein